MRFLRKLWPRSLQGQTLMAVALALLLAQGFSAVLLYRAQHERLDAVLVHNAAMRLFGAMRAEGMIERRRVMRPTPMMDEHRLRDRPGGFRLERSADLPVKSHERRRPHDEDELRELLANQDIAVNDVAIVYRRITEDPQTRRRQARRAAFVGAGHDGMAERVMIAAARPQGAKEWMVVRLVVPPGERALLLTLLGQTLLIYAVLVGAIAFILGRITRPLAALTRRVERFAATRDADGQLVPEGPDDLRRLIVAHNGMEARIAALLDEKDVMLGAIGHDLKTPLSALRVRIESVEDDTERAKMAATIEDIVRSLDDILSLARVGRPSDPVEPTELSALVASVVEEYEDMGEPVTLDETRRVVLPLRATWLRRAIRNLVSNALRYGKVARVSLLRTDRQVLVRIEDDGPGIPDVDLARMMEPFQRGDPSRNSETGGAGLGLALARAIAEQHGGSLTLANRTGADGQVAGLIATLALPLP